jgi:hypothetical protein
MMGALPPNPRDLPLLFSRMDAFRFTRYGDCRTIDLLARRTGQRGDATRAPMQVRNGWRPHGRLLAQQPAALSKDCRFFVQPTRTTSYRPHRFPLIAERDKLDKAIAALGGSSSAGSAPSPDADAKRAERSARMKAIWAAKRKAKHNYANLPLGSRKELIEPK